MRVMAAIPARGGSKGLPGKNLLPCAGKPLLAWSVEAGLAARLVDRVVVSSDSAEILATAATFGAKTLMRPAFLATDTAATDAVLAHALRAESERPDLVVLLQPTVPVRAPGLVDACIRRLLEAGADSLLTAYPLHFVWWRENTDASRAADGDPRWRSQCPRRPRRQDMEARELMFHEDGSVYVTRADLLERTGRRLGGRIELFETERTVDVDAGEDLALADAMLKRSLVGAA